RGAAAIEPAVVDPGPEGVDGHVIGGHGVLVGFQEQRARPAGRVPARDDVVAQRGHRLALVGDAKALEEVFQVGGDAVLIEFRPLQRPAHRVDTGQGDQVTQEAGRFRHGFTPGVGSGGYKRRTRRSINQSINRGKKRFSRKIIRASRPSTVSGRFFRMAVRIASATVSKGIPWAKSIAIRPSFRSRWLPNSLRVKPGTTKRTSMSNRAISPRRASVNPQ